MSKLQSERLLAVLDRKPSQMDGKQLPHREDEENVRFNIKVALWDLLTALEDSDDEFLKDIVGSTDFVAKARSVMIRLDSCCGPVPAVEAMLNDIILDEVCKHADVKDLLQFRLVNKQWYDAATNILAKEKSFKISITQRSVWKHGLSDLMQDFEGLKRVPITTLELDVGLWVSPGSVFSLKNHFTVLHGPHIKKIILTGGQYIDADDFDRFLLKLFNPDFPNVEHLVFRWKSEFPPLIYFGDPNVDLTTGQVPVLLPSVKTMSFDAFAVMGHPLIRHRLLVTLLRAAENLETVIGHTDKSQELNWVLLALQTAEKQGTLKEVQFDYSNSSPHTLRLLAEINPKLKIFGIRKCPIIGQQAFSHSLIRILDSSRESLTRLTIYAFCDISRAQMGILPNLKYLNLYYPRDPNVHQKVVRASIVPKGAVWSETFPKLEALELELNNFDKKTVQIYFPADIFKDPEGRVDSLLTVTTLTLDCRFTQFGLKALARKFPNVQSIQAKNYKELFLNEESVWLSPWNRLEHLELGGFDVCQTFCSRSLDSFFTGFSDSICDKLRQIPEDRNDNLVRFDLRVITSYPSVRDLYNLRKLKIVFQNSKHFMVGKNVEQDGSPESLGISYVTAKYAFNVMPLLQVTLAYDQSNRHSKDITQLLKPLSSYGGVTLVHEAQK